MENKKERILEDLKIDEAFLTSEQVGKIKEKYEEWQAQLLALRFHLALGKLTKTHQIPALRRQIARLKTLMNQFPEKFADIKTDENVFSLKTKSLLYNNTNIATSNDSQIVDNNESKEKKE
jgi:ribosomal protein L29